MRWSWYSHPRHVTLGRTARIEVGPVLLALAGEAEAPGELVEEDGSPWTPAAIAAVVSLAPEDVEEALGELLEVGTLERRGELLVFAGWAWRAFATPAGSTERMRRKRRRDAAANPPRDVTVTPGDGVASHVTPGDANPSSLSISPAPPLTLPPSLPPYAPPQAGRAVMPAEPEQAADAADPAVRLRVVTAGEQRRGPNLTPERIRALAREAPATRRGALEQLARLRKYFSRGRRLGLAELLDYAEALERYGLDEIIHAVDEAIRLGAQRAIAEARAGVRRTRGAYWPQLAELTGLADEAERARARLARPLGEAKRAPPLTLAPPGEGLDDVELQVLEEFRSARPKRLPFGPEYQDEVARRRAARASQVAAPSEPQGG